MVTAAMSWLPRCCRGGDRGEHVAKGSGDVGVALSAAWLCDAHGRGEDGGRSSARKARRRGGELVS